MANHKWDSPKNKLTATCQKCGIIRFAVHKRFGNWEYLKSGITTLKRPECATLKEKSC